MKNRTYTESEVLTIIQFVTSTENDITTTNEANQDLNIYKTNRASATEKTNLVWQKLMTQKLNELEEKK